MPYKSIPKPFYQPPTKPPLLRGVKKPLSRSVPLKSQMLSPANRDSKEYITYANIMDISRFLSTYLSGKTNIYLSARSGRGWFTCSYPYQIGKEKYYLIVAPDWREYDLPLKDELSKYRIYRFGIAHEAFHARYTPKKIFLSNLSGMSREVLNILEDRRIEDLGCREWSGYLPERLFANSYAFTLRPSPGKMWEEAVEKAQKGNIPVSREEVACIRFEAFLQQLLVGKIKDAGKLPQAERDLIEEVAKEVGQELAKLTPAMSEYSVADKLLELTERVVDKLDLRGVPPPRLTALGSAWEETFAEEYAKKPVQGRKQPPSPSEVEKGIEERLEELKKQAKGQREDGEPLLQFPHNFTKQDVEDAKKGSNQVVKEFKQAKRGAEIEVPELAGWLPVAKAVPPNQFRNQQLMGKLETEFKHLKKGRIDLIQEWGERLSIPAYIITKGKKPFIHRVKTQAKGKLLILADFSGSIRDAEDEYKRALVSISEVLSKLKVNLSLFAFSGNTFYKIKKYEDGRWTPSHSAKLVALPSEGTTPIHQAYEMLEAYIRKHRPDVMVTITDGAPDYIEGTEQAIRRLRKYTRMVAFGIGEKPEEAEIISNFLKRFPYHGSFAIHSLRELPRKLVKLIAPEVT